MLRSLNIRICLKRSNAIITSHSAPLTSGTTTKRTEAKPFEAIPSPPGSFPLLGHFQLFRKYRGAFLKLTQDMFKELGPIFKLKVPGGGSMVFTNDPSAIEVVFRNEGAYPIRSKELESNMEILWRKTGNQPLFGLIGGKTWRRHRSALSKLIVPANTYSYIPGFDRATLRLIRNLLAARNEDGYVEDIQPLLTSWGAETSAYMTLGIELDMGGAPDSDVVELQQALTTMITTIGRTTGALALYRFFPTPTYLDFKRAANNLRKVPMKYIAQAKKKLDAAIMKGERYYGQSVLERLLVDKKLTDEESYSIALGLVSAALDATVNTASYMVYELAKNPEVQNKVREQVVSVVGESGEIDMDSLQKMPYLMKVIKETQRLHPISPGNSRTLPHAITLLGYHLPAKTTVTMIHNYADKSFKEPDTFDPDRWGRDDTHPFSLLPFGFGSRSCWGRHFAVLELKLLLAKICQQFHLHSDCAKPLVVKEETFIRPAIPVSIKLAPR